MTAWRPEACNLVTPAVFAWKESSRSLLPLPSGAYPGRPMIGLY
jgi:hypothetical protein